MNKDEIIKAKIVLVGPSSAGKTSIVEYLATSDFSGVTAPTVGAEFTQYKTIQNDRMIKLEIWDTAGQEKYRALAPMYYRMSQGAIIVYDITKTHSFEEAKEWMREVREANDPSLPIILVGNKKDLETQREVQFKVGNEFAAGAGCKFFETSAKTGECVKDVFEYLAGEIRPTDGFEDFNIAEEKSTNRRCCK
eukprot:gnl/Chilomastix_caulleri/2924.p1 GENE.gnl/Chilomastix_caulleri/2924~~gnl/Chilomastix_caulleri/2924.p1  ORF type:complete len:193 (+),score=57.57 gnl/Chilomastix_caulleri/2924:112-690(+)